MTHLEDILKDIVFSRDESLQEKCDYYTVTKYCLKFGNLQIFWYMSNGKPSDGLWDTIPRHYENDILESMKELNIKITVSRNKYISQLFTYF